MIYPNYIDEILDTADDLIDRNATGYLTLVNMLRAAQKQWAADREAYEVLDSHYRSMRDQLFALTNQMVHEANHIHDVREMRTS